MDNFSEQQQDVATARQGQGWPFGVAAKSYAFASIKAIKDINHQ
ncbi:hypothetical protein [Bacterioplanoides sp.]